MKQNYRYHRGRRHYHLLSTISLPQRVINLKASLPPPLFYLEELPGLELRRESGWHDGGLCPFHEDRQAGSFKINLDSGAFRCFSCGAAGSDVIAFYRLKYCCDFTTALIDLERRVGICQ